MSVLQAAITKPHARVFSRKRDLRPMEDEAQLEALSSKYDASLFAVGTSNKKRPNCITFGRCEARRSGRAGGAVRQGVNGGGCTSV